MGIAVIGCGKGAAATTGGDAKPKQEQGVDVELSKEAQEAAKLTIAPARQARRGRARRARHAQSLAQACGEDRIDGRRADRVDARAARRQSPRG